MKLLFDENLSPRLPSRLGADFARSEHLREAGLTGATDGEVWAYAKRRGLVIVSKDADFRERSLREGHPPKIVWLDVGTPGRTRFSPCS